MQFWGFCCQNKGSVFWGRGMNEPHLALMSRQGWVGAGWVASWPTRGSKPGGHRFTWKLVANTGSGVRVRVSVRAFLAVLPPALMGGQAQGCPRGHHRASAGLGLVRRRRWPSLVWGGEQRPWEKLGKPGRAERSWGVETCPALGLRARQLRAGLPYCIFRLVLAGAESWRYQWATHPAPALPSSVLSRMLRMSASSSVSSSGCWATYGCTHWTWGQSGGRGARWYILIAVSRCHCPTSTQQPLDPACLAATEKESFEGEGLGSREMKLHWPGTQRKHNMSKGMGEGSSSGLPKGLHKCARGPGRKCGVPRAR